MNDLSWPPNDSMNQYLSHQDLTLQYVIINVIVASIKSCGLGTYIAKKNLAGAFRHILVRRQDSEFLNCSLELTDCGNLLIIRYSVHTVLPFGYDDALKFIVKEEGVTNIVHYINDYATWHAS